MKCGKEIVSIISSSEIAPPRMCFWSWIDEIYLPQALHFVSFSDFIISAVGFIFTKSNIKSSERLYFNKNITGMIIESGHQIAYPSIDRKT